MYGLQATSIHNMPGAMKETTSQTAKNHIFLLIHEMDFR